MKNFSEADLNLKPVSELERQIMSGELLPVCINDGWIVALEEE
ncbi:hypothetical protein [Lacrimispora sp.]